MSHEGQKPTVRSRRIALAALLALACSQLVFAGHQYQHEADSIDDVCAACLQLEQFDNPTFSDSSAAAVAPAAELALLQTVARVESAEPAPYSSRAPPTL